MGMQVSIPEKKLNNLRRLLEDTCKQDYAGARHIASLIGKIISMGLALGKLGMHGVRCSNY